MTSQNNIKLKSVVGVVALLGAITGLITAVAGPEGLPKLIATFQGQEVKPIAVPISTGQSSGSQKVEVTGDRNLIVEGPNTHVESIQHSGDGNCNNIQASGQSVTIICSPASSSIPFPNMGSGFPLGASALPVKLQASVEGLQRGSDRFTLLLVNATSDQSVDIPTTQLALSDDQGNTYEIDRWTGHSMGLSKVVPPNGRIKLDYKLSNSIAPDVNAVTFTLDSIWAQPTGSQFKQPLPPVQWTTPL